MQHGCELRSTRWRSLLPPVALLAVAFMVAGCVAVNTGAGVPRGRVSAPVTIPSDCSRDVTAPLQAWIDATPDGSALDFARNGCYRIDGTLHLTERNQLTLEGNGATFRAGTSGRELPPTLARTRSQFSIIGGGGITIRDVIVRGANPQAGTGAAAYVPELEAQHAFVLGQVNGALLDHVQAYDVYGDFVYIGPGNRRITVRDSTFSRNGRQGWTVVGGEDIVFDHNSISETRRATIDMEPLDVGWITRRVTFSNNVVGPGRLLFFANQGVTAPTSDVSIIGNRLVGKEFSINVQSDTPGNRSRYRVIGNTSDEPRSQSAGGMMWFRNISDVEVRGNSVPAQAGRDISGVALSASTHVSVTDNQFLDTIGPLVVQDGSTDVHQSGNLVGNPLSLFPAS